MGNRQPNLGALRTFEAAARHLSFTRAAGELGVTPAAVSYLVREIETQLGVQLFQRTSRSVRLTEAGTILNAAVAEALQGIGRAVSKLRTADRGQRLNVTATPSFAIKWLVPRLDRFLERVPGADVRIDMSRQVVDLAHEDMDVAIRFGTGPHPGLDASRLFSETVFPVCSPSLVKGRQALRHPRDLKRHTLIHVDWQAQGETWPTWQMWLKEARVSGVETTRGIRCRESVLAIQAAIDGQGVALGDAGLTSADLAAGRLVRPFALSLNATQRFAYWLVMPPRSAERALVAAFRDWLIEEAAP